MLPITASHDCARASALRTWWPVLTSWGIQPPATLLHVSHVHRLIGSLHTFGCQAGCDSLCLQVVPCRCHRECIHLHGNSRCGITHLPPREWTVYGVSFAVGRRRRTRGFACGCAPVRGLAVWPTSSPTLGSRECKNDLSSPHWYMASSSWIQLRQATRQRRNITHVSRHMIFLHAKLADESASWVYVAGSYPADVKALTTRLLCSGVNFSGPAFGCSTTFAR